MPLVTFQTHSFTARIFELSLIYVGQMYKINIKAVHKVAFLQCTRPLIKKLFLLYFRSKRYSPAQFLTSRSYPLFLHTLCNYFSGDKFERRNARTHTYTIYSIPWIRKWFLSVATIPFGNRTCMHCDQKFRMHIVRICLL